MLIVGSSSQSADDNKDNLSSPATIDQQHHHHHHSDPLEAGDHTQQQLLSELERFEVQLKQLAHLLSQTLNNHDQANSRQKLFNTISYAASHISFLAERCSNSRTLQASLETSICVPNHLRPQQQQQTSSNVSNEGEQLKAMQAFQKQLLESSDGRISNGSDNLIAILPHLLRTRCLTELEQILAHSQASKVDFEQPKDQRKMNLIRVLDEIIKKSKDYSLFEKSKRETIETDESQLILRIKNASNIMYLSNLK